MMIVANYQLATKNTDHFIAVANAVVIARVVAGHST